jgi:hypothetical protein
MIADVQFREGERLPVAENPHATLRGGPSENIFAVRGARRSSCPSSASRHRREPA